MPKYLSLASRPLCHTEPNALLLLPLLLGVLSKALLHLWDKIRRSEDARLIKSELSVLQ